MSECIISFVTPTRNQWELCFRSLQSLADFADSSEVIIVNDASDCEPPIHFIELLSRFKYYTLHRNEMQMGPSCSRQTAILMARGSIVIPVDSDDELNSSGLLRHIKALYIMALTDKNPAAFMLTSHTKRHSMEKTPDVLRPKDLLLHSGGDYAPIIFRRCFLGFGLSYPSVKIGGEGLLWLEISKTFGIPVINDEVIKVNSDGLHRITSPLNQLNSAHHHFNLKCEILRLWGNEIWNTSKMLFLKKCIATIVYARFSLNFLMLFKFVALFRSISMLILFVLFSPLWFIPRNILSVFYIKKRMGLLC